MSLEGWQVEQVTGALISGFNRAELTRLVHMTLDTRLEEIVAPNSALSDMAYEVVTKCDRDGTIATLIDAACRAKPNNPDLRRLAQDSRRWSLAAPRPAQRTIYQPVGNRAPTPPADFVPRPEEYDALLAYLLAEDGPSGPIGITGLYGAGGYGKTTLAQKLCHDPAVVARYPDGILWVELKEEPGDLTARLLDQVYILTDRRPEFRSLDAAQSEFAAALGDRHLLLVVDDVWKSEHLEPFLQGGPHCTRLVTTRFPSVLPGASSTVRVDAMKQIEAVTLLGAGLPVGEDAALQALAARLGEWPFLLRPVNGALRAYVKDGLALPDALKQVSAELTDFGLDAFTGPQDAANRKKAATACIEVSLRLLLADDRARFADLAVFPEDADVPFATLEKLWSLPAPAVLRLSRTLGSLSLLQRLNLAGRTLRLHDVMRTYLRERQTDLPALHARLLDAYGLDDWTTLPASDPYLWDHLAYHLDAAGRHDALRILFLDDRWLQARVAHDGYLYDGYIADLNVAWTHAHAKARAQIEVGGSVPALAESVHYALIRTSINSLSTNYPPELVAMAVKTGFWPSSRALSVAEKITYPDSRADLLIQLLETDRLSQDEIKYVESLAVTIKSLKDRVAVLAALSARYSCAKREEVLKIALALAEAIEEDEGRVAAFVALAVQLDEHRREEVLTHAMTAAARIDDAYKRGQAYVVLLPHLDSKRRDEALRSGWAAVKSLESLNSQSLMLSQLLPYLQGEEREHTLAFLLAAADRSSQAWLRGSVFATLVPELSGTKREYAIGCALTAVESEDSFDWRIINLVSLLPHLESEQQQQLVARELADTANVENDSERAERLALMSTLLGKKELADGLVVIDPYDLEERVAALATLATHLGASQKERVLNHVLAIVSAHRYFGEQLKMLRNLVPRISDEVRSRMLAKELAREELEPFESIVHRAACLNVLGPHFSIDRWEREIVCKSITEIRGVPSPAILRTVASLALENDEQQRRKVHDILGKVDDQAVHSWGLCLVESLHGSGVLEQALDAAETIQQEALRAEALAVMAPLLKDDLQARAFDAALMIDNESNRAQVLEAMVPHLSDTLLEHAIAAVGWFNSDWYQLEVLQKLMPKLKHSLRQRALEIAAATMDEMRRAEALAAVARYLDGTLLELTLDVVERISNDEPRAHALGQIAPHLSTPLLERAFIAAKSIKSEMHRADALSGMALYLNGATLDRLLAEVETLKDEVTRAEVLMELPADLSTVEMKRAVALAAGISDGWWRALALSALCAGDLALPETTALIRDSLRSWLGGNVQALDRHVLLESLANPTLFAPPIFDQASLDAIAQSIMDVCWEWRWL